jgi:hypothetical protein
MLFKTSDVVLEFVHKSAVQLRFLFTESELPHNLVPKLWTNTLLQVPASDTSSIILLPGYRNEISKWSLLFNASATVRSGLGHSLEFGRKSAVLS